MAKPNLVNATSIYAKSLVHTGTGTSTTVLSCPSNKAYRITAFAVTGTGSSTTDREKWEARLNRVGVATGVATFGARYDSDGGSYQDDWLPGKSTVSLPVGWVMNETDTLVIRGDASAVTLIGWEVIDDA
tara:strand:+ start:520 stop:909 length:390 start_codon:yes stop_codon:yes gene_type:complete